MTSRFLSRVRKVMKGAMRAVSSVPELGIFFGLVAAVALFSAINSAMLSRVTLLVTLRAISYAGIAAVGMTFLLTTREIDLSVGAVAALAAVVAAWMMTKGKQPIPVAVLAGMSVGIAAGLINGLLVVKVGAPSIVITLAMRYAARGLSFMVTGGGYPIYPLPASVGAFGAATPGGVAWAFWILMTLVAVGHAVLTRTTWGQMVVTTGGNKLAAEVSGIRTDRVKIACFVLTSLLAAVAGMLVMARIKTGATQIGDEWELDVITAVLVGGASLAGGIGTVLGSLIGMIFLQAVRSGLVIVGVSAYLQQATVGIILLVAASLDLFRRGRRRQA